MEKKCPVCGQIVRVADNIGSDLMHKCKGCGSTDLIKNYISVDNVSVPESRGAVPELVDIIQGKSYPLSVGRQIVGKCKPGSDAQVQIETANAYVSRYQFYVEVLELPTRYKTCIWCHESAKNKTKVGDDELAFGDVMVLNDSDIIDVCGLQLKYKG
jgi:hypothetical protein